MKKTKILVGLLIAHVLNSCGIVPEVLPDETQSGKNTFGCKINGKIFTLNNSNLSKNYDGGLVVGGENNDGIGVIFGIDNVTNIGTYYYTRKANLGYLKTGACSYGVEDIPLSGKVQITKFERGEDKTNNLRWLIVSGRFEGVITSRSKTCKDTIRITEGRFDVKFQ